MSTYAERKQRIYEQLAVHERTIGQAEPDSLDWHWWSVVLELVEQLPQDEQATWKDRHLPTLRDAVRTSGRVPS